MVFPGIVCLAAQIYTQTLLFSFFASYFANPLKTLTSLAEILFVSWEVVSGLKGKKPSSHGVLSLSSSSEISGILDAQQVNMSCLQSFPSFCSFRIIRFLNDSKGHSLHRTGTWSYAMFKAQKSDRVVFLIWGVFLIELIF